MKVDLDLLRSVAGTTPGAKPSLELALFDDRSVTATADEVVANADGFSWRGPVASGARTDGFITLTLAKDKVVAVIGTADRRYAIESVGSGVHAIVELDAANLPAADDAVASGFQSGPTAPAPAASLDSGSAQATATTASGSGPEIDVLVVFTEAAVSQTDMQARAAAAMNDANAAYANSGVSQRVRLAGGSARQLLSYQETNNSQTDLDRLQATGDLHMNEVHGWRDDLKADVVALYVSSYSAGCGLGYLMNPVSASFQNFAFNTQSATTGCHNILVLPHELGHNMAAHHDRPNATSTPAYPYAYGWVSTGGDFRTVMAYDNPACPGGSCPPIPYFSNPDMSYLGHPTGRPEGQPDAADNRKTLNNTAFTVASFRTPRADLIAWNSNTIYATLSTGTGFGPVQSWGPGGNFSGNVANVEGDINGDGRADLVAWNSNTIYATLSTGTGFGPVQSWGPGGNFYGDRANKVGDVNGDGRADLIAWNSNTIYVMLSTGTGFGAAQSWGPGVIFSGGVANVVGDVNGDDRSDLIAWNSNTIYVSLSSGAGFGPVQSWGPGGNFYGGVANVVGDINLN